MFDGIGPDVVLERVGTKESMDIPLQAVRPGGKIGFVGVPDGGPELDVQLMFDNNVGVDGGVAFVRDYIPELLPDMLDGTIQPGKVFDLELPLAEVADAYQAMDKRHASKVLLRP
jgi:threonine dehydrogenase-like Zn-dependent dehydrogenase